MAKKLKTGNCLNGYEIIDLLNVGALAIAYSARNSAGEKVFFKQYKSPSVTLEWYKGYVAYQTELKRRIEAGPAERFCYRFIEFFEAKHGHVCYFQVFEFVEEGHDLEQILDKIREDASSCSWEQRLIFAKVIMAAVNALHKSGVIHCDLKPANIQLFRDETIEAGYVVKLIDMDYSILDDQQAPWHGHQGYVGSPRYFSPEHLSPGAAPCAASDVFTCGAILCELLTGVHPFQIDSPDDYYKAVMANKSQRAKLIGTMPSPAANADVEEVLYRCLSPDAAVRPSAVEMLKILNGQIAAGELGDAPKTPPPKTPAPTPETPTKPDRPSEPESTTSEAPAHFEVVLANAAGDRLPPMRITTQLGVYSLKPLGEDSRYFDRHQCTLQRGDDGTWRIEHNSAAKHQTLINGKQVAAPVVINDGDILAVGSEERSIQKLPLTVHLQ